MWSPPPQFSARLYDGFAAEATHRTTGRIKSVDLMSHVITLDDGSTYKVARGVNIKRMKAGQKVTLTTSDSAGPSRPLADHASG